MKDIFAIFEAGLQIYRKLAQDEPTVGVSLPALATDTGTPLKVEVDTTGQTGKKTMSVNAGSPLQQFSQLPLVISCAAGDGEAKLKGYIRRLEALPVAIFKEYAAALTQSFLEGNKVISGMAEAFAAFSGECPDLQMKFKVSYPACLRVYSPEKSKALTYFFADGRAVLMGFDEDLIDKTQVVLPGLLVKVVEVSTEYVIESAPILGRLRIGAVRRTFLCEDLATPGDESIDDSLDKILQRLILVDHLDSLQDIIIEEEKGTLYLCFDPVLTQEEVQIVLDAVKATYPQAVLSDNPGPQSSAWWVVTVALVKDAEAAVMGSGQAAPGAENEQGVIAKSGSSPVTALARSVDVGKALDAIKG